MTNKKKTVKVFLILNDGYKVP